jgi:hypothetical protein
LYIAVARGAAAMVGRGFLFLLPQQFFDDAECLGSATEANTAQLTSSETCDLPGGRWGAPAKALVYNLLL